MAQVLDIPIGVIICSSRKPRVCPQVTSFVVRTIEDWKSSQAGGGGDPGLKTPTSLHLIDLAEWNLPFFDEPIVPSQVKDVSGYHHPHTRAWSAEIQKYSAFIFVLPQYNWGYPAVLKNAIDYLFHEWVGKHAMIVSYGGHGGVKGAGQWRQVLQGVRMNVVETMPALTFPSRDVLAKASKGEQLDFQADGGLWKSEEEIICKAFGELLVCLRRD